MTKQQLPSPTSGEGPGVRGVSPSERAANLRWPLWLFSCASLIVAMVAARHALRKEGLAASSAERRGEPANHALRRPTPTIAARRCPVGARQGRATLAAACQITARRVTRDLARQCRVIVNPPFVITGDLSQAELQHYWCKTVEPAARAMAAQYFAATPDEPVTILLFADEGSYRRHAEILFGDQHVPRAGYYRPHLRTVLINAAAGHGALLHELTHALMAFDFPEAPDWLNEGLAALHEGAIVRADGRALIGQSGPRLVTLHKAIAAGQLGPLRSLLTTDDFHGPNEKLNYAHARYLCLYLQQQGVLADCYRRLRANCGSDPHGEQAVLAVLPGRTWDEWNTDFQGFVREASREAK